MKSTHNTSKYAISVNSELILKSFFKARENCVDGISFTFIDFSYEVVRLFFDLLHGKTNNEVSLSSALELMVFCNHEGQIDKKSEFETKLYDELSSQIFSKIKDPKKLCLIWMYLRSLGPTGKD